MMETTAKLLGEIVELKEYRHQVGKALARIEYWRDGLEESKGTFEARDAEWEILERVLRIFKEEIK